MKNPEPQRPRAVFSSEDFTLLREAIAHYAKQVKDEPKAMKFAHLYHRLSRLT